MVDIMYNVPYFLYWLTISSTELEFLVNSTKVIDIQVFGESGAGFLFWK